MGANAVLCSVLVVPSDHSEKNYLLCRFASEDELKKKARADRFAAPSS